MLAYFRIANHYNIVDKPNERSSHSVRTIRGGGVIFLLAAIFGAIIHPDFRIPATAIFIIGVISFADDRMTVSSLLRILFHLAAVTTLFYYTGMFSLLSWWGVLLVYVIVIGIINAYNFMDGINGITGLYSLVILGGLQYINYYQHRFINPDIVWLPMLSCVVFLYFNFRKKAKCFAGDVGSVTMALWLTFLLIMLILEVKNLKYILFLAVYGVDAVLTIIHRLILKQNIFKAHRLHFYQLLANEQKIPHLLVSGSYAMLQLLIIYAVIFSTMDLFILALLVVIPLIVVYIMLKPAMMIKRA